MTREEAIYQIKQLAVLSTDKEIPKITEALDMAIEALSVAVSRKDTVTLNSPISIQADMVSVVRCKDCRHGWYDDDIEYYTCRHPKGLNEELYGVDFCSYGERKE